MSTLPRGLYERLITAALQAQLSSADPKTLRTEDLHPSEAPDRIASHIAAHLRRTIESWPEKDRVSRAIALAGQLAHLIEADGLEQPLPPGHLLDAVLQLQPDGNPELLPGPETPLADSTVLTNSPGEPRIGSQIRSEIPSADRIDVVMAFIRKSGIIPLRDELQRHVAAGRSLRILTTTFTGTTDPAALDLLKELGAQLKVSYETGPTRLHAKAWLFHRSVGTSTAYIGSSNLTHAGQSSGLEWNVRVSGLRNPDIVAKVAAVFESYWNSGDYKAYDREEFLARLPDSSRGEHSHDLSPLQLRLEPFQERLLERISLAREQGRHRNLLVSATGTGKTVMAAMDYARLRKTHGPLRLLFLAHRDTILQQARATYAHAIKDPDFGELWVGGRRPKHFDHVFASIQSLSAAGLEHLDPAHFDVVVIDEFHHAAARTYRLLLDRLAPKELLGLTATPERADGLPVLEWFSGRIAAELRLWDAIDQHRLTPFHYFGVGDEADLRQVPWTRGVGYDTAALSNVLTTTSTWTRLVLQELRKHVDDKDAWKGLGFCVDVAHARHMAEVFNQHGLSAVAVSAQTPADEREAALRSLEDGRIRIIFSVDLYNEGVDLPAVDTLLLLRPTESPTLFIQQLGRGLRRSPGKSHCLVLDFVGQHRKEFRFDRRFRALLGGTLKSVQDQVKRGFPFLPAGCHMELDKIASERVLNSLKQAIPSAWNDKVRELKALAQAGAKHDLRSFLEETGLELEDVYSGNRSWSDLREAAGLPTLPSGPDEVALRRACSRLLHVDDPRRLLAFKRFASFDAPPDPTALTEVDRRLLRMLVAQLTQKAVSSATPLNQACEVLWRHPQIIAEVADLLPLLDERREHVHPPPGGNPSVPLSIHARYTRIEILSAFGVGEGAIPPLWQTGVQFAPEESSDLLAFTLNKKNGHFSPTTRYKDFAISSHLIHWESQSTTRADSETGRRYRGLSAKPASAHLFARLNQEERAFWYLGPATFVSFQSELPMQITWKLETPLPGDLFSLFAAAVA